MGIASLTSMIPGPIGLISKAVEAGSALHSKDGGDTNNNPEAALSSVIGGASADPSSASQE